MLIDQNSKLTLSKNLILAIAFSLAMFSVNCTFTTTRGKHPVFAVTTDQLQKDLNRLVSCENINVDGKEISTNGKTNAELEIDIVNGRDIPTGESEMTSLAKLIASDLKNSLKDRAEYNTYKVLFVTRYRDGGVTRKNWKGQVFKSDEL